MQKPYSPTQEILIIREMLKRATKAGGPMAHDTWLNNTRAVLSALDIEYQRAERQAERMQQTIDELREEKDKLQADLLAIALQQTRKKLRKRGQIPL